MKTEIYLHHGKYLCAIVTSQEGNKFIDNVEKFCTNWQFLIEEAKSGFDGFCFYDQFKNYDINFWQHLEAVTDDEENYDFLFCADDGEIIIDSEKLENRGEYFEPLLKIMKIGEAYNFHSFNDAIYKQNYFILSSKRELLICSNIKVPFEPKAEQKDLRKAIREKLSSLKSLGDQVLYAEYGCSKFQKNDIENALFYNIGISSFNNLLTKETTVFFQRKQQNEVFIVKDINFKYFYHYSCYPKSKQKQWWERHLICEWNRVPLKKVNSTVKAIDYYSAIKSNSMMVKCFDDGSEPALGMKIQLYIPKKATSLNILNLIKPMIDGVVCAFHTPDRIIADEVCKRASIAKDFLLSKENTCLGERCYVMPYRNSIKWNPQDDRLDSVLIETVIVDEDTFSFSGKIFALPNYM